MTVKRKKIRTFVWDTARQLGDTFPPNKEVVTKLLTQISERLRQKPSIFKRRLIDPWTASAIIEADKDIEKLQREINIAGPLKYRCPDEQRGESWDEVSINDATLATINTCNIPEQLSVYYLLGLTVIDQDLSDAWRELRQFVQGNLKKHNKASIIANDSYKWIEGLAAVPPEPLGRNPSDFQQALFFLRRGLATRSNLIDKLLGTPTISEPFDSPENLEKAKRTISEFSDVGTNPISEAAAIRTSEYVKMDPDRALLEFANILHAFENYCSVPFENQQKSTSRPHFIGSLIVLREIVKFGSKKPLAYAQRINNVFELLGVDLDIDTTALSKIRYNLSKLKTSRPPK